MNQVIIYKQDNGTVAVIIPTQEALDLYGLDAIAQKDVPAGLAYKIIEDSDLPDRSERNLWDVDVADLTDGVGSESNEFN
jgi:hypothetical protein